MLSCIAREAATRAEQNHPELPGLLGSWVTIIMGTTFVVCVLLFRRGIVGEIEHRLAKKS